jgi:hypothetical protein
MSYYDQDVPGFDLFEPLRLIRFVPAAVNDDVIVSLLALLERFHRTELAFQAVFRLAENLSLLEIIPVWV